MSSITGQSPPPWLTRPTLVMQIHDELVFECPNDDQSVLTLKVHTTLRIACHGRPVM